MIDSPELIGISRRVLGYPFRDTANLGEGKFENRSVQLSLERWGDGSGRKMSGVYR